MRLIAILRTQLVEAYLAIEKLADESFIMEADLQAQVVVVDRTLSAERVCIKHNARDLAAETKERQPSLAE